MFDELSNLTADERTLFYMVSDEIIRNFSQMGDAVYVCMLAKALEETTTIEKVLTFADNYAYADFFYAQPHWPWAITFQRKGLYVKVVLSGFRKSMSHEIHSSGFKYTRNSDRPPEFDPYPIPPRGLLEGGFAGMTSALLASNGNKPI